MNAITTYNYEIERYILGCLIVDKSDEVIKLHEDDFYNEDYKIIYKVIAWMKDKNKAIDVISVSDWASKKIENALETCVECTNSVTTTTIFSTHLETLKLYSTKRQLLKKANELQEIVFNSSHELAIDLKNDALERITQIAVSDGNKKDYSLKSIALKTLQSIEAEYNATDDMKLYTGYKKIDDATAGLHKQELTILAARPGVGKTAFSLNIMLNLAKRGNKCLFVSREMADVQLCKRIISSLTGLDSNKIRLPKNMQDKDWKLLGTAVNNINTMQGDIQINDSLSTIQEIRNYVRQMKLKDNIDVLFIDYLGLVKSQTRQESRRHEVEFVSRSLKELSLEFEIPVVCLCQLNRELGKGDNEPQLHHLRESGAIEQDADNVWMLHETETDDDNPYIDKKQVQDVTLFIRKQRNGPTGAISLKCTKNNFKYYND